MAMTVYRQMTDAGTNTTWEKKQIGALYSTMPRAIPEAAGVLARSMNTPEGISRVYDRAIAEKEAEWRGFDIRGANPRSPEGRALILERAQLYTAWKETEREGKGDCRMVQAAKRSGMGKVTGCADRCGSQGCGGIHMEKWIYETKLSKEPSYW
ncbi:MAG: hypothetical protein PUD73_00830 [bacterium]|nr:hypothetical protein [bacterium]